MVRCESELTLYWRTFTRLLYPEYCAACRVPLMIEVTNLCKKCSRKIESVGQPSCVKCARPLPPFGDHRAVCGPCQTERPYFHRGFSLVLYQNPINEIFHQIKFSGKPWLLNIFESRLHEFAKSPEMSQYDVVVPVPIDSPRARVRGYNQAELIARKLSRHQQVAPISCLLQKTRRTLPQSQLLRSERLDNLTEAFSVQKKDKIQGKQVLLVDDIFTTGSTINECAKTLKRHGADRVDFLTIARTAAV
jgi:competence protein ComFC